MSGHECRGATGRGGGGRGGQFQPDGERGWDPAPTESFFASLKKGTARRRVFTDAAEAERAVFEEIEACDNRERLHSSLGDVSPATSARRRSNHNTPPTPSTNRGEFQPAAHRAKSRCLKAAHTLHSRRQEVPL